MSTYVVGVDIGGTNLRIGVLDQEGQLYNYQKIFIQEFIQKRDTVQVLIEFIYDYLQKQEYEISAVAIGFPSTMNKERTKLYNTPNIKGLDQVAFGELLEEQIEIPVFLEKDVVMLFLNDAKELQLSLDGVAIGLYIGTGIGNVISVDQKFLTGEHGVACELGHIPVLGRTEICNCGNVGCLESYASGRGLESLVETHFHDTPIREVFLKHGDDPIIKEYVDSLSVPIATEINILDPKAVVLGGGVINMPGFPKLQLEECIYNRARKPFPAQDLKIYYGKDAPENGVLGAGYYAQQKLNK